MPSPHRREDAETFVRLVAAGWDAGGDCVWALRDDGELAGVVGAHRIKDGAAELATGSRPPPGPRLPDRGVARGGRPRVRPAAPRAVGVARRRRNTRSARVARSLGFPSTGDRRQGLAGRGSQEDGWIAGLLATDPRIRQVWPLG